MGSAVSKTLYRKDKMKKRIGVFLAWLLCIPLFSVLFSLTWPMPLCLSGFQWLFNQDREKEDFAVLLGVVYGIIACIAYWVGLTYLIFVR